jgi:hypothetical protein
MLDVHPPHGATHTWRDFFIHIATIVVGLCIAVGLEQSVEFWHHRQEVKELREKLRVEREEDRSAYAADVPRFRLQVGELQHNLRVLTFLQKNPHTAEEDLPGTLIWETGFEAFDASVWEQAQQTGVAALMPREESASNTFLYGALHANYEAAGHFAGGITDAASYALVDPNPTHLSAAQVQAEIDLTVKALERGIVWGIMMRSLSRSFPEFSPAMKSDELRLIRHTARSDADAKKLQRAMAIDDSELAALRAADEAARDGGKAVGAPPK